LANFVELRQLAPHYSVIYENAMVDLARGLASCHLLSEQVSTSDMGRCCRRMGAGRSGVLRKFNSDRHGFEPAEEE
jgi:hypothetical protein